jgi:hypothetical protein
MPKGAMCLLPPAQHLPIQQTAAGTQRARAIVAPAVATKTANLPWQVAMSEVKKRRDIKKIMIIGAGRIAGLHIYLQLLSSSPLAGPIVIGQACEFDYSGTQAVKALKWVGSSCFAASLPLSRPAARRDHRKEGYTVILLNSNPVRNERSRRRAGLSITPCSLSLRLRL